MKIQTRCLPLAIMSAAFLNAFPLLAQTNERHQTVSTPVSQNQELPNSTLPANANPTEILIDEVVKVRKSLQNINVGLREIGEKLTVSEIKQSDKSNFKQNPILLNLEILSRAEQRAEILRKQLIELIEKENSVKTRLIQMEEDARPESIERSFNATGSTRTVELRDNRRRILETERNGLQSIQNQIYQSRSRLEEDVRQADLLVTTLRQIVFPAIQKEIQNVAAGSN